MDVKMPSTAAVLLRGLLSLADTFMTFTRDVKTPNYDLPEENQKLNSSFCFIKSVEGQIF